MTPPPMTRARGALLTPHSVSGGGSASSRVADRAHQLGLAHLAAATNIQFASAVADLLNRSLFQRPIGIASPHRPPIGRSPFHAPPLVDCPSSDLFGAIFARATLQRT